MPPLSSRHHVTLRFQDGAERLITVEPGGLLLDAALEAGVAILHQCRAGSCSTCLCKLVSGQLKIEAQTSLALFPREIAQGQRLSCVSRVYSDSVVDFDYGSDVLDGQAAVRFEAQLTGVTRLNARTIAVEFLAENAPAFKPGQYFLVSAPHLGVSRAYSPATISRDLPRMNFYIRLQSEGVLSSFFGQSVATQTAMTFEGPFGRFRWAPTTGPLIFIAGGTGLAPILSIIDTIAAERRHRAPILLCFGVSAVEDLFGADEIELRQELMPRLEVRIAVQTLSPQWEGRCCHVTDLVNVEDLAPLTEVYLCGPPAMISAGRRKLLEWGVAEDHIHYESFEPGSGGYHEQP